MDQIGVQSQSHITAFNERESVSHDEGVPPVSRYVPIQDAMGKPNFKTQVHLLRPAERFDGGNAGRDPRRGSNPDPASSKVVSDADLGASAVKLMTNRGTDASAQDLDLYIDGLAHARQREQDLGEASHFLLRRASSLSREALVTGDPDLTYSNAWRLGMSAPKPPSRFSRKSENMCILSTDCAPGVTTPTNVLV
ncbi:hypothetical protein FVE85_6025 [Porphyridium purpureum]|uniref:Uncharacterized protein n=1 Tax=Porphyridium purpureum TaxID=35688 RepID=A0A5J4Z5C6_PORPP|nr:hypothetical protein FVE85_6025 [Porphyridium purpureum]|eukprot:POR5942..scf295_1